MTVLLLAEHDNKALSANVAKAMTAAKALGQDVHVLVAGADCRASPRPPPSSTASPRCCSRTRPSSAISWPRSCRR